MRGERAEIAPCVGELMPKGVKPMTTDAALLAAWRCPDPPEIRLQGKQQPLLPERSQRGDGLSLRRSVQLAAAIALAAMVLGQTAGCARSNRYDGLKALPLEEVKSLASRHGADHTPRGDLRGVPEGGGHRLGREPRFPG